MAHCNTLFHSMLNFIPRHQFAALEGQHNTGRTSRKFSRWNQFVHLMFMQLTGRASLRDGIQSMNSRAKDLYHLGRKTRSHELPLLTPTICGQPRFTKLCLKNFTNGVA